MEKHIPTVVIALVVTPVAIVTFVVIFWLLVFGKGIGAVCTDLVLAAALLGSWIYILQRTKSWRAILLRVGSAAVIALCIVLVGAAIVGNMAQWRVIWFINRIDQGWLSFVFVRLGVLSLMVLAISRLWRVSAVAAASVAVVLILVLGVLGVLKSHSPEGTYGFIGEIDPVAGDRYWVFSEGKVEIVFADGRWNYGRYEKTNNGWVVVRNTEQPAIWRLKFSVFGFRLINTEDHDQQGLQYPRRIIPFLRPKWMPDWLQ